MHFSLFHHLFYFLSFPIFPHPSVCSLCLPLFLLSYFPFFYVFLFSPHPYPPFPSSSLILIFSLLPLSYFSLSLCILLSFLLFSFYLYLMASFYLYVSFHVFHYLPFHPTISSFSPFLLHLSPLPFILHPYQCNCSFFDLPFLLSLSFFFLFFSLFLHFLFPSLFYCWFFDSFFILLVFLLFLLTSCHCISSITVFFHPFLLFLFHHLLPSLSLPFFTLFPHLFLLCPSIHLQTFVHSPLSRSLSLTHTHTHLFPSPSVPSSFPLSLFILFISFLLALSPFLSLLSLSHPCE